MTKFHGFDLTARAPSTRQFTCRGCPNVCRITEVRFGDERPFHHGARCERYDVRSHGPSQDRPDLFRRREEVLFNLDGKTPLDGVLRFPPAGTARGRVGIPRALLTWDTFPFFCAYFR
ncbi:MAG: hypothetical protein ABID40_00860, partial [Candidatus Bipolaricaulota bacterium]